MPELPEVENVARSLSPLIGQNMVPLSAPHPHERFSDYALARGVVNSVYRKGKWLVLSLGGHGARCPSGVAVHLGMSGQILVQAVPETLTHTRAQWGLEKGGVVTLRDPRAFGRVVFRPQESTLIDWLSSRCAPDPFEMNQEEFWAAMSPGHRQVKARLLDQSVVSGVGNIYADESLWAARVNPFSRTITRRQSDELLEKLRDVLAAAIDRGGSTLRDYRRPDGSRGAAQSHLACYGRAGEPCVRCGSVLTSARLAGRSTVTCPVCQGAVR